ncbi:2-amino-4-hydroxy-6-hydroxymethyldihydropteridine diphosphokinase [Aeromonas simiae]|uniref:2-amino-4-hydroxy-6- hydroxymethyldihydropteridine diphosphokinase n=1 Tax=Aeromonas simiae TaxID=218936 RepID=UPI0005AAF083|nr:2-amino-4-hydroxy-6-hydroxymethyldihydropteridine diphosphokinase [Aeromonas simiae]
MYYLCSIGSNIEPLHHVNRVIGELLEQFGRLSLSSAIRTQPVGMVSQNEFINCLFVIHSPHPREELKRRFIQLELAHGRDRGDPACKIRDRPLDIDILACDEAGHFLHVEVDEYLRDLLAELHGMPVEIAGKIALSPQGRRLDTRPQMLERA